jgi:hypothetical protein
MSMTEIVRIEKLLLQGFGLDGNGGIAWQNFYPALFKFKAEG